MPLVGLDRWARAPRAPRFRACHALGVSIVLACGGRAADGLEPEANGVDGVAPRTEPRPGSDPPRVTPVRETCEDNPLLAGCEIPPAVPPPVEVEVDREEPQVGPSALNVLASYCGPCHGPALTPAQASGGINYINDWDRLFETGLVECAPASSRVVQVMRTGEMPPPMSGLIAVPDADIDGVEQEIALLCTEE